MLAHRKIIASLESLIVAGSVAIVTVALAEGAAPPSRADIFQEVWQTVCDNFFDPHFNGIDWDAAQQRFGNEATKARSDEEFSAVINAMLAELRTSHTHFYT